MTNKEKRVTNTETKNARWMGGVKGVGDASHMSHCIRVVTDQRKNKI